MIEMINAFKKIKSPEIKKLLIGIYEKPISLDVKSLEDEAKNLLEQEADFGNAKVITDILKLTVPPMWYENGLQKAISTGRYWDVSAALNILDRPLSYEEISKLIEQIILTGNMRAMNAIEEETREVFDLSIWQNIMIHRTVKLLWEKKNEKISPLSHILTFHLEYKDIFSSFKIKVIGTYTSKITRKTFQYFDQHTMSTFLHYLLRLESDPVVKNLARQIKSVSAVS